MGAQNIAVDRVRGENRVLLGMENNQTPERPLYSRNLDQKHFNHRLIPMYFFKCKPNPRVVLLTIQPNANLMLKQFLKTLAFYKM